MDPSLGNIKQPSNESVKLSSSDTTEMSVNISTDDSPILRLPQELLSAIIDYVPKTQWPSLELMNRSFRDGVYSSYQSMKEFDIGKDALSIRQLVKGICLSDHLSSILEKLVLRSPMLTSIIGFPEIHRNSEETRSEILQIICQFTNLKRIDFGAGGFKSLELVAFLTSSASRDRLMEISSSSYQQSGDWGNHDWPEIFIDRENSESQASPLKLEKLYLKGDLSRQEEVFLEPRIIDLIDPSSLKVLVLDEVTAPSDYLLSLITNCCQLQQLQFSFMARCRCGMRPCFHSTSSKQILEAIPEMESLDSLKIGLINSGSSDRVYLGIEDDLLVLIDRLGSRGRLMEFGLLHGDYCSWRVVYGIADHLAGLKSLKLITHNCHPAILVNMIKKMLNLEKLAIVADDDWFELISYRETRLGFLQVVAAHLKNLRSFHLYWASDMDLHELTSMEHLEELSIDGGPYHKIKWESASAFGHQLQSLELWNCDQEFVAAFLKNVNPGLRRLFLSGYSGYWPHNNRILRMIPTACPRLRQLHLLPEYGFCVDHIKGGVQTIIDGCLELEILRC